MRCSVPPPKSSRVTKNVDKLKPCEFVNCQIIKMKQKLERHNNKECKRAKFQSPKCCSTINFDLFYTTANYVR